MFEILRIFSKFEIKMIIKYHVYVFLIFSNDYKTTNFGSCIKFLSFLIEPKHFYQLLKIKQLENIIQYLYFENVIVCIQYNNILKIFKTSSTHK